jgi:HEPN domain-containing protein
VGDLLEELSNRCQVPRELMDWGLELDKAYIPTRYPNAHPSGSPRSRYTKGEATRHIEYASRVVEFCASLLSEIQ